MRDSMATQIDFPDVRIELSELKKSDKGNEKEKDVEKDSYEDDKDFEDMPQGIDLNERNVSSGLAIKASKVSGEKRE